jgi:hypothetical protein
MLDFGILFSLMEKTVIVLVIYFLIFHAGFFNRMVARKMNWFDQVILIVIFGILAIYSTYSGVQTSGAICNVRNLGPMQCQKPWPHDGRIHWRAMGRAGCRFNRRDSSLFHGRIHCHSLRAGYHTQRTMCRYPVANIQE